MRTLPLLTAICILAIAGVVACEIGDRGRTQVVVFAAASLRDVAGELARELESRQAIEIAFNFAGSNTLAQQIDAAPGADVFLSADENWVEFLERSGRLVPGSRRHLLSNRLVLIAHRDAEIEIDSLADLITEEYRFVAVADPEAVPAGRYARAYLERSAEDGVDLWSAVSDRVVPALDVRAALALVESDPEILGIVYRTDAKSSERVRVAYEFPPIEEVPIAYWGALVAGGALEPGTLFLEFLHTPEAATIIARHGFVSIPR